MKYLATRQITFPTGDVFSGQEVELDEKTAAPLLKVGAIVEIAIVEVEKPKPEAKQDASK